MDARALAACAPVSQINTFAENVTNMIARQLQDLTGAWCC